jgi:ketosteroid isomerase-like protein
MNKCFAAVRAAFLGTAATAHAQVLLKPSDQFQASMDLAVALRAKDVAKTTAALAPNVVLMPPGRSLLGGKLELEAALKSLFAAKELKLSIASIGSEESGNLGYDTGSYELTLTTDKGATVKEQGKYMFLMTKIEKRWVVTMAIWNADAPVASR